MPAAIVRRFPSSLALMTLLLPGFAIAAPAAAPLANFPTPQEAQQRCPDDLVVWLDLPTRTYHYRSQRWYGSTKNGADVCRNEAVRAGMRAYAKCGMSVPDGFIDPPGYTGKFRP
jgi:hypothetical protein